MGLMVIDTEDRYALPVFGVCISKVDGVDIMVWDGDYPDPNDAELLKRYE